MAPTEGQRHEALDWHQKVPVANLNCFAMQQRPLPASCCAVLLVAHQQSKGTTQLPHGARLVVMGAQSTTILGMALTLCITK